MSGQRRGQRAKRGAVIRHRQDYRIEASGLKPGASKEGLGFPRRFDGLIDEFFVAKTVSVMFKTGCLSLTGPGSYYLFGSVAPSDASCFRGVELNDMYSLFDSVFEVRFGYSIPRDRV